jgi:hypothetical protein
MSPREFLDAIECARHPGTPPYRIYQIRIYHADGTQSDFCYLQRGDYGPDGHTASDIWHTIADLDVTQDDLVTMCDPVGGALWADVRDVMDIWNKED